MSKYILATIFAKKIPLDENDNYRLMHLVQFSKQWICQRTLLPLRGAWHSQKRKIFQNGGIWTIFWPKSSLSWPSMQSWCWPYSSSVSTASSSHHLQLLHRLPWLLAVTIASTIATASCLIPHSKSRLQSTNVLWMRSCLDCLLIPPTGTFFPLIKGIKLYHVNRLREGKPSNKKSAV